MIKTGIDLVLNSRISKNLSNPLFVKKVFLPNELKNHEKSKLIGIFALKEAFMKAIGKKVDWKTIEIQAKPGKKPEVLVNNYKMKSIDASLSHDGDYTMAIVVLEL